MQHYNYSYKDIWFNYFTEALEDCLDLGLSEEDAEHEASLMASEKTTDYFDGLGDYLYECNKNREMEEDHYNA